MATYTYQYTQFGGGTVAVDRLTSEINASDAIVTKLVGVEANDDSQLCSIEFAADISEEEKSALDDIVAAHSGEPLHLSRVPELDELGRSIVVPEPQAEKSPLIIVTHNWCDPCTWWTDAERVTDQTLTDSGDGLTFTSPHQYWIDLRHGRQYAEDRIDPDGAFVPVVKVDGVQLQERPPFSDSGGDYVVDYESGAVTFFQSQAGKTVTASYWRARGSIFKIQPSDGRVLWITGSEVQFSTDVEMLDTVHFQAWAYDPSNPPSKVPVTPKTTYKTIMDFVSEARGCYPQIPAIGGSQRGLPVPHIAFPFAYLGVKELRSSLGLEVRIWLEGDNAFSGTFANATFYCLSYEET